MTQKVPVKIKRLAAVAERETEKLDCEGIFYDLFVLGRPIIDILAQRLSSLLLAMRQNIPQIDRRRYGIVCGQIDAAEGISTP